MVVLRTSFHFFVFVIYMCVKISEKFKQYLFIQNVSLIDKRPIKFKVIRINGLLKYSTSAILYKEHYQVQERRLFFNLEH